MRNIALAILAFIVLPCSAVDLRLHGEVTNYASRTPLDQVLVRVYRDGVKEQSFSTGNGGNYTIDLERDGNYVIRFSLPGHVTKCFAVDTHGAAWQGDRREVSVDVEMTLFENVPDMDLSLFDLPMGLAHFCPATGFLSWDAGYEARMRSEVERLMEEMRLRKAAAMSATRQPEAIPARP
jgi:hypothetical protein